MPVLPGAEPYAADGGPVGALLVHGFTGNPGSMRPWGEHLAAAGLTVRVPRLPGHGTRWQEMADTRFADWYAEAERAFDELRGRCERVYVGGLSMGGTIALSLAERRAGELAGVVLVNPALTSDDPKTRLVPLVSRFVASVPPVGDDIKKPGVSENAYPRVPLKALTSLLHAFRHVRADLAKVTDPLLVFRSTVDHVVPASSVDVLVAGATSTQVDVRALTDSFHVATLDNDAPRIFAESLAFMGQS